MSISILKTAIGAAALSLILTPAWAQGGHQMAGMTQGSGGSVASCTQNSAGVTRAIDVVNARIEDARQTNDASKLRESIADLQVVFAQIKSQLADCVALAGEGGAATGGMVGTDHSKMQMAPGGTPATQPGSTSPAPGAAGGATAMAGMDHSKMPGMAPSKMAGGAQPKSGGADHTQMAGMDRSKMAAAPKSAPASGSGASSKGAKAAAPASGMDHSKMGGSSAMANPAEPSKMAGMDHSKMAGEKAAPAAAVMFAVRTDPAPPRSGKNDFEVTLKDPEGKPITDAAVSLAFYMPAMPSMKTDGAQLLSAGNGVYKGSGTVGMSGDWDVTITAARGGQTLATKKMKLTAK